MSFILEQSPTFKWPITIREVQDGGRVRTHSFDAIYRRLPQSRMEAVQLQYQAMKSAITRNEPLDEIPTRGIAEEILEGWEGITDPEGSPVPVTAETRRQLLEVALVADVLVTTYFEAHEKARAKN